MTTDDLDAMDDMQNATRALAEKIKGRASNHAISPEGRTVLLRWVEGINDMANTFAGDCGDAYVS